MSIKNDEYAPFVGRINPPDSEYPYGSFKDRTTPGNGTPFLADWCNDKEGFFQGLLYTTGTVPNGNPDTVESGQYLEALQKWIGDKFNVEDYTELRSRMGSGLYKLEDVVYVKSVGMRGQIKAGTTDNTGTIISDGASGFQWEMDYSGNINPTWFGAAADDATDDSAALIAADAIGSVDITGTHYIAQNVTFTNRVIFSGGYIRPSATTVEIDFEENDTLDVRNFGAKADAVLTGEVLSGTDNYIPIQSALFSAARTNGKITVTGGGGGYRADTGLVNFIAGVGSCSVIGKGLQGFKIYTNSDITVWHLGGSAQTIKRLYVVYGNPSLNLTSQLGVRFANDDFQWSQSVIEQVWVQNAYRSFVQSNETGTFGTVFLNTYRNLQSISARDWGFHFDSKNGSTTLHLDTCYVKGNGSTSKGIYTRNIKEVTLTNTAIDGCVDDLIDISNVNVTNIDTLAIESNSIVTANNPAISINSTYASVNGITDLGTTIDVGVGNEGWIFGVGSNVTSGIQITGYVELSPVLTSGTKKRVRWGTQVNVETDSTISPADTSNNGFHAQQIRPDLGGRVLASSIAPTYGTWKRGDKGYIYAPSAGGVEGYVCVTAGSPGTWKSFGNISA